MADGWLRLAFFLLRFGDLVAFVFLVGDDFLPVDFLLPSLWLSFEDFCGDRGGGTFDALTSTEGPRAGSDTGFFFELLCAGKGESDWDRGSDVAGLRRRERRGFLFGLTNRGLLAGGLPPDASVLLMSPETEVESLQLPASTFLGSPFTFTAFLLTVLCESEAFAFPLRLQPGSVL